MYKNTMNCLIASEARKSVYRLIDDVANSHEPTVIKGKRNTAILVSVEDWEDITETIMVATNKELSDSLIKGMNTPFSKCSKSID